MHPRRSSGLLMVRERVATHGLERRCSNLIELFKGNKIINFVEKSGDRIIREFELTEEIRYM